MYKRVLTTLFCVLALSFSTLAAPKPKKTTSSGAPDKAYLQKTSGRLECRAMPADMAQYYDQGDYNFFDIAPLKYSNWAEYQKGVTEVLKDTRASS